MSLDVFPRRNLGLSENWGRSVESRITGVTKRLGVEIQSLKGLGRYSASAGEEFARNAASIERSLLAMPRYFSASTYNPAPSVGTAWVSIASISIPVPEDKDHVDILATASAVLPYPGSVGSAAQFVWPFDLGLVTSEYGPRDGGFHQGIDFAGGAASAGNPIPAAGAGVVADAVTLHPGWGNYVRLEHNVGGTMMSTLYAHMVNPPSVSEGSTVTQGQTLGYVGNTGNSFGAHLHFETWTSTIFGSHADPRWFMSMFGTDTAGSAVDPPLLRINIDGAVSLQFRGLISTTTPIVLTYVPVFGRTYVAGGSRINISLEAISGGSVTGSPTTLAVTGSFKNA